jgi:adenylyltransferase/sulfurtransferase
MDFTEEQLERYSRHIILPEVGGLGQSKLLKSRVFVLGAGGLGSPALLYLAAAGVGTIGIADGDAVDLSNLQRQIIHNNNSIGASKVLSAKGTIEGLNSDVKVNTYNGRLTQENISSVIRDYDVLLDGSDNFPTRYLINDAAFFEGKPLVSGSMFRFDGQVTVFNPHKGYPCYRCLYPEPPPRGLVPSCQEAGVLGALAGVIGLIQSVEAIKQVLGIGDSMKDPACALCGEKATIKELLTYEETCELQAARCER